MFAGIGLMAYPSLANYINNKYAVSIINDYQNQVENTDEAEIKDMIEMATAYNDSLPG